MKAHPALPLPEVPLSFFWRKQIKAFMNIRNFPLSNKHRVVKCVHARSIRSPIGGDRNPFHFRDFRENPPLM